MEHFLDRAVAVAVVPQGIPCGTTSPSSVADRGSATWGSPYGHPRREVDVHLDRETPHAPRQ